MTSVAEKNISVELKAVDELLALFHPDNPREHDPEGDVKQTASSLLEAGWVEVGITLNTKVNKLVGGHGRCLATKYLSQQDQDWFENYWDSWLARNKKKYSKEELAVHKTRYSPSYWVQCPVLVIDNLAETDHLAMMVRLNNSEIEGVDIPKKLAEVLAKIDQPELAGWDKNTVKSYVSTFLTKSPVPSQEINSLASSATGEYLKRQGIQTQGDEEDDEERDDFGTSLDSFNSEEKNISGVDGEYIDSGISTDGLDDSFRNRENVRYDSSKRETRQVLWYDRVQSAEFKKLAYPTAHILKKLGYEVDDTQSIKLWRPDAVLEALRHFVYRDHVNLLDDFGEPEAEPEEEGDSDET